MIKDTEDAVCTIRLAIDKAVLDYNKLTGKSIRSFNIDHTYIGHLIGEDGPQYNLSVSSLIVE